MTEHDLNKINGLTQSCNCAGFIIIHNNNVALVKTKKAHYGFPKGKKKRMK